MAIGLAACGAFAAEVNDWEENFGDSPRANFTDKEIRAFRSIMLGPAQ